MSRKGRENFSAVLDVLGAFGTGYFEAKNKQLKQERDAEIVAQMNNPELSEVERARLSLQLSKKGQKAVTTALKLYTKLQHQQELARRSEEELAYKKNREGRIKQEHDAKELDRAYRTEIKDIQDQIKDTPYGKDVQVLKDKRDALQNERSTNTARMRKGEEPVLDYLTYGKEQPVAAQRQPIETMSQMGGGGPMTSFTPSGPQNVARNDTALRPTSPQVQQGTGSVAPTTAQPQRVRWDKNNPEHQALAAKIFADTGKDRAKTNAILAETFER